MNKISTLFVFTTGVSLGVLAGALTAPHKGSITRARVKNRLKEGKDLAEEKAQELRAQAGV